jgi:hypothetical protein
MQYLLVIIDLQNVLMLKLFVLNKMKTKIPPFPIPEVCGGVRLVWMFLLLPGFKINMFPCILNNQLGNFLMKKIKTKSFKLSPFYY